jgi:hypothetical protein
MKFMHLVSLVGVSLLLWMSKGLSLPVHQVNIQKRSPNFDLEFAQEIQQAMAHNPVFFISLGVYKELNELSPEEIQEWKASMDPKDQKRLHAFEQLQGLKKASNDYAYFLKDDSKLLKPDLWKFLLRNSLDENNMNDVASMEFFIQNSYHNQDLGQEFYKEFGRLSVYYESKFLKIQQQLMKTYGRTMDPKAAPHVQAVFQHLTKQLSDTYEITGTIDKLKELFLSNDQIKTWFKEGALLEETTQFGKTLGESHKASSSSSERPVNDENKPIKINNEPFQSPTSFSAVMEKGKLKTGPAIPLTETLDHPTRHGQYGNTFKPIEASALREIPVPKFPPIGRL